MTFTDLETILRQAAKRVQYDSLEVAILLETLAQDIRDFIEAEKADAEGKKS